MADAWNREAGECLDQSLAGHLEEDLELLVKLLIRNSALLLYDRLRRCRNGCGPFETLRYREPCREVVIWRGPWSKQGISEAMRSIRQDRPAGSTRVEQCKALGDMSLFAMRE